MVCGVGPFGLVWFGLVWFGLVWFGLVWFCYCCCSLFLSVLQVDFERNIQATIDQAFQSYQSATGPSTVTFTAGRETYQIDFVLGQQANVATGVVKAVRRVA
jgi:hypothetical protein